MANQRWTSDKNIEFINEYRQNSCLWDPKHYEYKNRNARKVAYKNIKEAMQMDTIKDVIYKIRILRNTYNNEMLKAKKCMPSVYVSRIPWLSHMDFLKNIEYSREYVKTVAPKITTEKTTDSDSNTEENRAPSAPKRKLKPTIPNPVHELEIKPLPCLNTGHEDEFDLFGRTVAEQLRQLPLETALETEEIILSTIRRRRISLINQTSSESGKWSSALEPITILKDEQGSISSSE